MIYKTEVARITRTLWGLRPDGQSVVYKGEELEEIALINRFTEGGWRLMGVTAIATDILGGTSEVVIRYYLGKE